MRDRFSFAARPRLTRWWSPWPPPGKRTGGRRRIDDVASARVADVSGVTCHSLGLGHTRQRFTRPRTSLMFEVASYCCSLVDSPLPSSKTEFSCPTLRLRFLGSGIGVMNSARRQLSIPVPSPSWFGAGSAIARTALTRPALLAVVRVEVLPPPGGTTLVPIPRAGARAQGLLQCLGVRETLARGLGQTS
jgi:hypothetical protein